MSFGKEMHLELYGIGPVFWFRSPVQEPGSGLICEIR